MRQGSLHQTLPPTYAFIHTDTLSKLEYQLITRERSMKFEGIYPNLAQRLTVSAGRGSPFSSLPMHAYVHTCMHTRAYRFYWNTRCAGAAAASQKLQNLRGSRYRDVPFALVSPRARLPRQPFFCVFSPVLYQWFDPSTKYRGVARVCPADGSEVTCCY